LPIVNWSWTRFDDLGVRELYEVLALRCRVFVLEQGPYLDPDGVDLRSWHLQGRDDAGVLQAYLRGVEPGIKYAEPSIGRVISAQTRLRRFYVELGFEAASDEYIEDHIPHLEMLWRPS
jgi:ElaA protein